MLIENMKFNFSKIYIVLGLSTLAGCIAIILVDSISFYEFKYGRDVVFKGTSKYLLASSVFSVAAGFVMLARKEREKDIRLQESISYLIPFTLAMVFGILAYVFEGNIFG